MCTPSIAPAQAHKRKMRIKQKRLALLQDDIDKKKQENAELDRQLQEAQVMVIEKKNVENLAGETAVAQNC